jgi:hypothetical protein
MSRQEFIKTAREQEKKIDDILTDSTLYLGMSSVERRKLLHFIVSTYFKLLPVENSRALPLAMQAG